MSYVFLASFVLLAGLGAYRAIGRLRARDRARLLRWALGWAAVAVTLFLAFFRRFDLAAFTGVAAYTILRHGRLGRFSLGGDSLNPGNLSRVKSRYFDMELDHESGAVTGRVLFGQYNGWDLIDLGEMETRALIAEISHDADSLALLESWLDANRAGWREYFAEMDGEAAAKNARANGEAEAYAILGLEPGASDEDIRAAHRELMKGVHPDHGGSSFLASKINEARDLLLRIRRDNR